MSSHTIAVEGWGRWRSATVERRSPTTTDELSRMQLPEADLIPRGLGRSYGDAAQRSAGTVVDTTACDNVYWVDRGAGVVRCDAGVSIGSLIDRFAPKGWFVPVSPGTRHVTVGGAIAADIHGKNHHIDGSFGDHVRRMRLRLADNTVVDLSPTSNKDLFWATVGGMGLTGIVIDADLALTPIATTQIAVETSRLSTLNELMATMRSSDRHHRFSVAWVDLLGGARSVLTQGSFATPAQVASNAAGPLRRPRTPALNLPPMPPMRFVRTPGVRAFNELWWRRAPAEPTVTNESITAFFHPLDAIRDWPRLYGSTGFVQWQCVVPDDQGDALLAVCDRLGSMPAYFTVLKRFGASNAGPLSFPMPGWTLAVDLPAIDTALESLHRLDEMVVEAGGRIYLAKDARMRREVFEISYPRLDEWKSVRRAVDPGRRFASDLSHRLGL